MGRRRYISTDISLDRRVNQLSDFAALLYTWMVPHADDSGSITADPEELGWTVIPGRRRKSAQIAAALQEMLSTGLLIKEGDRLFFPCESFYRYQSYIPPAKRRVSNPNAENQRKSPQIAAYPSPSPSPSPKKHMSGRPDVAAVFEYWKQVMGHPDARLEAGKRKREKAIEARLNDGYTVDQLKQAIDGCKLTPHNMGENDAGTRYDDIELICRDEIHVERFMETARARNGPRLDELSERRIQAAVELYRSDPAAAQEQIADDDLWLEVVRRASAS